MDSSELSDSLSDFRCFHVSMQRYVHGVTQSLAPYRVAQKHENEWCGYEQLSLHFITSHHQWIKASRVVPKTEWPPHTQSHKKHVFYGIGLIITSPTVITLFVCLFFENSSPSSLPVLSGVPQGSVLGPVLFFVYVNDIPSSIYKTSFYIFADDTKISKVLHSSSGSSDLQYDIDSLLRWCTQWNMFLRSGKCVTVRFGYSANDSPLPNTETLA